MEEIEFLPDIYHFIENNPIEDEIETKGLEELIAKIRAKTGLPDEQARFALKHFFQIFRDEIIKGHEIRLDLIGNFSLVITGKNNNIIYPIFRPTVTVKEEIKKNAHNKKS